MNRPQPTRLTIVLLGLLGVAGIAPWFSTARGTPGNSPTTAPAAAAPLSASILAASPEAAGRYLVSIAGCNDCHTPEYNMRGEAVPESQRLIGVGVGFKGPWGTSYAANLRAKVQKTPEDSWVAGIKTAGGRPPMPWEAVHAMSDADLHNLYRYIYSLGGSDNAVPAALPPGQWPTTPYIVMEPVMPK